MIEIHLEKLRSHARGLAPRALRAAEYPSYIEATRPERRPAKQPCSENAERDRHREFAPQPGEGRDRQRHDAAHDLDRAREHDGIGRTKHLQQQIENDNGDDAGNQGWHGSSITASAPKSMCPARSQSKCDHFIWPISAAAPLVVFDSRSSASRPPAA